MSLVFIAILIIMGVLLTICIVYYICTLEQRRQNDEKIRREMLLYEENYQAEKAKQNARIAGEVTRQKIKEIAKSNE